MTGKTITSCANEFNRKRAHEALRQQIGTTAMAMMDEYHAGELSGLIFGGETSAQTAASIANSVFRAAKRQKPTGDAARSMLRAAMQLEAAAEAYRQAAARAYPALSLVQAAE